jgi:hypothetical protein
MTRLALAAIAVVALARPASAEINIVDSIEWATADSDVVVRGTITQVAVRHGDGAVVWYDATVAVTETIKGPKRDTIRVGIRYLDGDSPDKLRARKADLLLFLVAGKRLAGDDKTFAKIELAPRHTAMSTQSVVDLGATARAYTATFAELATTDELLATVRTAAKSTATSSFRVDVPGDTAAYKSLYGGSAVWMFVPVDALLEPRAIGWLATHDLWLREQGVAALAHFRSAANIARVVELLGDTQFVTVTDNNGPKTRRYLVRAKAHEVLDGWHVKHATPTIDQPAP